MTLYAYVKRENPNSGLRTIALSAEAEEAARTFAKEKHGKTLEEVARGGRVNRAGEFTFLCGGGYALKDDLLGGDYSGKVAAEFEEKFGHLSIKNNRREMNRAIKNEK